MVSKLNQYKELETNDGIKEYLTANNQQFVELCKRILLAGYNLQSQKTDFTPYGCQILATEKKQEAAPHKTINIKFIPQTNKNPCKYSSKFFI